MFFKMFFIKVKKHVFMFFICKLMFLSSMTTVLSVRPVSGDDNSLVNALTMTDSECNGDAAVCRLV